MGLMIRLRQQGARNAQTYRLVVMPKVARRDGMYLENLGWYNPHDEKEDSKINAERLDHWLSQGAILSEKAETLVRRLAPEVIKKFDEKKMLKLAKKRAQRKKKETTKK